MLLSHKNYLAWTDDKYSVCLQTHISSCACTAQYSSPFLPNYIFVPSIALFSGATLPNIYLPCTSTLTAEVGLQGEQFIGILLAKLNGEQFIGILQAKIKGEQFFFILLARIKDEQFIAREKIVS